MWVWVTCAITIGLWLWAGRLAWDVMMRTGRGIESGKISQQVHEMFGTEADIRQRMLDTPNDPAPAIKYASMAGNDWGELKQRAQAVVQRFPTMMQGGALLARALWELGEKDEARKVTRRLLQRYPRDPPMRLFAAEQALDLGQQRRALHHARAVRKEYPEDVWAYLIEVNVLIDQKKYLQAETLLNDAEARMPDNEHIDKLWDRLHAEVKPPPG